MNDHPPIYGSPGQRARFTGLVRAALPFCAALVLVGYTAGALLRWPSPGSSAMGLSLLALALAVTVGCAFSRRRLDAFLKGARGEERVAQLLAGLDGRHAIFHGVDLSAGGSRALWRGLDLDHVVVAPNGIFAIETKRWRGRITRQGGDLRVDGRQPQRPPLAQARRAARALDAWLARRLPGLPPTQAVLCFDGGDLACDGLDVDGVIVCSAARLTDVLARESGAGLNTADFARVVSIIEERVVTW